MAYRKVSRQRRYRRTRRFRPASSYAGKSLYTFAKNLARPGAKLAVKLIKSKLGLNTESKYIDNVEAPGTAITTTATLMTSGIVIPQGNTTITRGGNSCRLTQYHLRVLINAGASQTATGRVRIIGFVQPRVLEAGQTFAAADIVQDGTVNFYTPYNMDTNGYKVILDRDWEISPPGQDGATASLNFHYSPLDHQLQWTDADTTGSAANLLRGNIRFFIFTDLASNAPTYYAYHRVKFVDN